MSTAAAPAANAEPLLDPQENTRGCVICCDSFSDKEAPSCLIKACRHCTNDYCHECLREMFTSTDPSRMPPRCCVIIQLHVAAKLLSNSEIDQYRGRFEEWMTIDKTYCPSPSCSALIPSRRLPKAKPRAATPSPRPTITTLLRAILKKVEDTPSARFFRDAQTGALPNYWRIVGRPMTIDTISRKLAYHEYKSINHLTVDFRTIRDNAKLYHGPGHPVTKTSHQLLEDLEKAISSSVSEMVDGLETMTMGQISMNYFPCPNCHIAICSSCKQIEHGDKPCDLTASDHETAMLEQFGYKRCPRCKHGVRKMYGCFHMQCHCGAHWCWGCGKSTDMCLGCCDDDGEDNEDDYYSDEEDSEDEDKDEPPNQPSLTTAQISTSTEATAPTHDSAATEREPHIRRPVNLDGGGAGRWADAAEDFGDEPDEQQYKQIWSCVHEFVDFEPKTDEHDRGDLTRVECNQCFTRITASPLPSPASRVRRTYAAVVAGSGKRKRVGGAVHPASPGVSEALDGANENQGKKAWECEYCFLLVCPDCKEEYKSIQAGQSTQEI